MERKVITEEMKQALLAPLPDEAISQHPTKTFLSTIKAIYVTERLNDVFGVGAWKIKTDLIEKYDKMVMIQNQNINSKTDLSKIRMEKNA